MFVMGAGVLANTIVFQYLSNSKVPVILCEKNKAWAGSEKTKVASKLKIGLAPENKKIDLKLVVGSTLFGIGWGLAGICPGPGLTSLGAGANANAVYWCSSMFLGTALQEILK